MKWPGPNHEKDWHKIWAPMMGLGVGLTLGFVIGAIVAISLNIKTDGRLSSLSPMWTGAFFGSFVGLINGEIYNGYVTWAEQNFMGNDNGDGKSPELAEVYFVYPKGGTRETETTEMNEQKVTKNKWDEGVQAATKFTNWDQSKKIVRD